MKRILTFDGGGIRGLFSLQIAARVEALLREAHGRPDLVLADVVDLFAGTSTGAIIAACLAWGASVEEVEQLYLDHARAMFARQRMFGRLKAKYRADSLAKVFRSYFAEADGSPALLGSGRLKKLLLVVMRNASTGSPWPISSNPRAAFNDLSRPDSNLRIPLWQLLRASTAAPMYFPPEEITVGSERFLFVDGGVTPFNNPSLLAVLMATLPCYRLEWPAGREHLHVIAIGTGMQRTHLPPKVAKKVYVWDEVRFAVPALMQSVSMHQDVLCRVLGDCVHGAGLDSEIGALDSPTLLPDAAQRFTYVRYNVAMDSREIGLPLTRKELELDNLKMMPRLRDIGRDYAAANVNAAHLWPRAGMATVSAGPARC
jgi:hypothetical protein